MPLIMAMAVVLPAPFGPAGDGLARRNGETDGIHCQAIAVAF